MSHDHVPVLFSGHPSYTKPFVRVMAVAGVPMEATDDPDLAVRYVTERQPAFVVCDLRIGGAELVTALTDASPPDTSIVAITDGTAKLPDRVVAVRPDAMRKLIEDLYAAWHHRGGQPAGV